MRSACDNTRHLADMVLDLAKKGELTDTKTSTVANAAVIAKP